MFPTSAPMLILGIDPGTAATGFGLVEKNKNQLTMIQYGVISTPAKTALASRLLIIYKKINALIKKYQPDLVACEQIFFFKNAKTAITVGHARGVILLCSSQNKIPVFEATPLQVKQAVSCYGRANKEQVQKMVKLLLKMEKIPKPDDAADALACAICAGNTVRN